MNPMSKWICGCLLLSGLIISLRVEARDFDRSAMDRLFDSIEMANQGMGSVSIFYRGQEIYRRGYGYANYETKRVAHAGTKYRIASISKVFTASIVMKLVEEGRLSLDMKLSKFYPQLRNADDITLWMLLSHRSGCTRRVDREKDQVSTLGEYLDRVAAMDPALFGEAGNSFSYANFNYVLLTLIAEKVSGSTYSELLERYITRPLHLRNTYPGGAVDRDRDEAPAYRWTARGWQPVEDYSFHMPSGAGCLVSTPEDVNTFIDGLFHDKVVSEATLSRMLPPRGWNYGLGLMRMPYKGMPGYGHNGIVGNYRSLVRYYPGQELCMTITSNAMIMTNNDIMNRMLDLWFETR